MTHFHLHKDNHCFTKSGGLQIGGKWQAMNLLIAIAQNFMAILSYHNEYQQ